MPIDRRITNGLAWAGALIVVAIPVADLAMSQFSGRGAPQVAMLDAEDDVDAVEPSLPTPSSERPRPQAVADIPEVSQSAAPVATPEPAADTTTTATATRPATSGGNAVDSFVSSGKPLPSYISGASGPTSTPTAPATTPSAAPKPAAQTPARPSPPTTTPAASTTAATTSSATTPAAPSATTPPAAATEPQQVAALPPARVTGFPTPVSQRPTSAQRPAVVTQPPLIIDQPVASTITADDLEEWESGPLSEFLANRQGGSRQPVPDYDPNGFFLDQGPNSSVRVQRFPRAYDDGFYPFQ